MLLCVNHGCSNEYDKRADTTIPSEIVCKIKRYNHTAAYITTSPIPNLDAHEVVVVTVGWSPDDRPSSDVERRGRSYQRRPYTAWTVSTSLNYNTGGHDVTGRSRSFSLLPVRNTVIRLSHFYVYEDRTEISIGRLCRLFAIFTTVTRPSP